MEIDKKELFETDDNIEFYVDKAGKKDTAGGMVSAGHGWLVKRAIRLAVRNSKTSRNSHNVDSLNKYQTLAKRLSIA